jgi:hypothetical protein
MIAYLILSKVIWLILELNEAYLLCFSLAILLIQRDVSPIVHLRSRGFSARNFKMYSL